MTEFIFRDARPDDKDEVLALTEHTWNGGDYIGWVFDDWLNDPTGRFLIAEDNATGRIAAIDKLSFFAPTEAWFEGLRVHPEYRGHGLANTLEGFMIEEARRLGARSIRLLTNVNNLPVHRNAYRHGFSMRFIVRYWEWKKPQAAHVPRPDGKQAMSLRPARPNEAASLYDWWQRTSAYVATEGLLHRRWSFSATSVDEWVERAGQGQLYVPVDSDASEMTLPAPLALISRDEDEGLGPQWVISAISANSAEWDPLVLGLVERATGEGVAIISGLVPDSEQVYNAFTDAGFTSDGDYACLALFELFLD